MLLNDDPGIIKAGPSAAEGAAPEPTERREPGNAWQWLLPWLLAFAGMLITLVLGR
jgi:hypothetical protein